MMTNNYDENIYVQIGTIAKEMFRDFSEGRELTMPFKHETCSNIMLNTGTFIIESRPPKIKNVMFNDPATIVFWDDGTKTVVKCENEEFDKEKGLAMAFMKKMLGNKGRYFNEVKKWTK